MIELWVRAGEVLVAPRRSVVSNAPCKGRVNPLLTGMVLSNKERQARYREGLKARAALRPTTEADRDFARKRIASYEAQLATARAAIARIDKGMTFHSASGREPMRDVTAEYRADQERRVELFEDLIRLWGQDLGE